MAIEYDRINWLNEVTPLNATNLNKMDKGIDDAVNAINGMVSTLLDVFYPVGSYYETSDPSFDPNVSWGGVWSSIDSAGRVTVALSSDANFNTIGKTGGVTAVTLTTSQIPSHTHKAAAAASFVRCTTSGANMSKTHVASGSGKSNVVTSASAIGSGEATYPEGGGGAHTNLQPYVVVKRWHRTA